jgi:hypothetical protein
VPDDTAYHQLETDIAALARADWSSPDISTAVESVIAQLAKLADEAAISDRALASELALLCGKTLRGIHSSEISFVALEHIASAAACVIAAMRDAAHTRAVKACIFELQTFAGKTSAQTPTFVPATSVRKKQ